MTPSHYVYVSCGSNVSSNFSPPYTVAVLLSRFRYKHVISRGAMSCLLHGLPRRLTYNLLDKDAHPILDHQNTRNSTLYNYRSIFRMCDHGTATLNQFSHATASVRSYVTIRKVLKFIVVVVVVVVSEIALKDIVRRPTRTKYID